MTRVQPPGIGGVGGLAWTAATTRAVTIGVMPSMGLPGVELVEQGLDDLTKGVESIPALLVSIGHPRLRQLGYSIPSPIPRPELRLYETLTRLHGDAAHSKYNSLIRRLVSFERAAACAR